MKPRILIAIHYMEIGGAERSLVGLLNAIDTEKVDVDLFVYSHRGEFMALIPEKINLLPEIEVYSTLEKPMKQMLLRGHAGIVAARVAARVAFEMWKKRSGMKGADAALQYVSDFTTPLLPSLHRLGRYDLAISFVTPHRIVLDKVDARVKAAWIHTDYSYIHVNARRELRTWQGYDYVVSISDDVTRAFLTVFPTLADKIVKIENILSPKFVRRQATLFDPCERMPKREGELRICSVGRYSLPKNFDNVPWMCRKLVEWGYNPMWYIIGYGQDEALIRRNIDEAGMAERVILLGKQDNPYPYMAACDVYAQPSRYEGKSVTVREAQMLCRPVVIANYATAPSQVKDGVDGLIVPLNNEDYARGIARVADDGALRERLCSYLRTHDYGNEAEVEKIYSLLPKDAAAKTAK